MLVSPVGCSVFGYDYFDVGNIQAAHGRAPAVATAVKRSRPDSIVITYQGDGDLAAIGTAEIVHAANRGEDITVIFVNNAIYGMTGGQMAPTTLLGQTTTTSPLGRDPVTHGYPIRVCELLATLEAPVFIERVALGSNKQIMAAGRVIRRALENQVRGLGFSLVEVLSPCPTIWELEPAEAQTFVRETMTRTFPLGNFRDRSAGAAPRPPAMTHRISASCRASSASARRPGWRGALPARRPVTDRRPSGRGGRVRRAGGAHARRAARRGRARRRLPRVLAALLRPPDALGHGELPRAHLRGADRLPAGLPPNVLIALNEPSLRKFLPSAEPGGLVLYNADRVPEDCAAAGVRITAIPSTAIADRLGSPKAGNMVMLGALLEATGMLPDSALDRALHRMVTRESWYELDRGALQAGRAEMGRMAAAPAGVAPA